MHKKLKVLKVSISRKHPEIEKYTQHSFRYFKQNVRYKLILKV